MKKINIISVALVFWGIGIANAQFSDLYSFAGSAHYIATSGSDPMGSLTLSGSELFGMTSEGGISQHSGVIFSIDTNGNHHKILYRFSGFPDAAPNGNLILSGKKLFGMTSGYQQNGNIFSIDSTGANYKSLFSFNSLNTPNGAKPLGSLVLSGTKLFGMTESGGNSNGGVIFSIDTNGNNFKVLLNCFPTGYCYPMGSLVVSGNKLYGMTSWSSTTKGGVFSIDTNGSGFTVLLNFTGSNGNNPNGSLILLGHNLFGMTPNGGANSYGVIFSIDTNGNRYRHLYDFDSVHGVAPFGDLTYSGGKFYGMTSNYGAKGWGTAFSIDSNGSNYSDLIDFNLVNGANPQGDITLSGNVLYGMTIKGGAHAFDGVIFKYNPCTLSSVTVATTNETCNGGNSGIAIANPSGGSSPYTYSWGTLRGTTPTVSNLSAGTYTVTVTDKNGCRNLATAVITQPNILNVSANIINNVLCNGGSSGSLSASATGGTSPYMYAWTPGGGTNAVVSNLSSGSFTVTVTDSHNCSATASAALTQPSVVSITISSHTNVSCALGQGSATANAATGGTSPYNYNWTPTGGTNLMASNLNARTYTITATDINGCKGTASVTITQPASGITRDSILAITHVGCNGGTGGSALVGVKGGLTPYTFQWSNGKTTAANSGLSAGIYTVTVINKGGCSSTLTVTITQPAALRDSLAGITYPTCNRGTGSATVGVKGGTAPYTYTWTGGVSTTATANNITSKTYAVTIKDAHSCSASLIFTLTQPVAIHDTIISALKVNVSCKGGNNGSASVGVKYGTSPYTYSWSNGETISTATGLSAGVYSITVTDKNGCASSTTPLTITQPTLLRDSVKSGYTCNSNLVTATIGVKDGTSPYTYAWSPGGGTKATMSNLTPGTYTIAVRDKNGCSNSITFTFTCPPSAMHDGPEDGSLPQCCGGVENISLYPNPNNGQFMISVRNDDLGMITSVEIYNILGQNVYSQSNIPIAIGNNSTFKIDLSSKPTGMYFYRLVNQDGNLLGEGKILIQK